MSRTEQPRTAERISQLRQSLGLSQVEFSDELGVSVMTVHRWEHGQSRPSGASWNRIRRLEQPTESVPRLNQPPLPTTEFVGRADDIAAISRALSTRRLVSLIGPGGIGKTRLALEVARTIAHGPKAAPVGWLDLTMLEDGHLIPDAIARAVGYKATNDGSVIDQVIRRLGTQPIVLIFDNCEHLVDPSSALISALLTGCPSVHVLATSRIALGVPGEQRWPVSPLSLPRGDGQATEHDILTSEAGMLFLERARLVRPTFNLTADNARVIADICHRLDGLPLALELAAARVSSLSPAEIADRLGSRLSLLQTEATFVAARHRAIRATLAWSYDLLTSTDRLYFARLGVSAGAFDLATARALIGDLDDEQVIALLDRLVARSLLTVSDHDGPVSRYQLLETIRVYALERLVASNDQDVVRERHANHFAALASRASVEMDGPDQVAWFARIDADRSNVLAALAWFAETDDFAAELRMANALWRYWWVRGLHREGQHWLMMGLTSGVVIEPEARAQALTVVGVFAVDQTDWATAHAYLSEGLTLSRQLGDQAGLRFGLIAFALWGMAVGDLDSAEAAYREALIMSQEMGDDKQVAMRSFNLISVALARNDLDQVDTLFVTILPWFREYSHRFGLANANAVIAAVASRRNDLSRAHQFLTESLAQFEELEYPDGIAMVNDMLGHIHRRRGDWATADRCLRRALYLWRIHVGRHRVAHALRSLAMLEADRDHPVQAIQLAGAAESLAPSLRYDHLQWIPGWFDSKLDEIRATIGNEAYDSSWTAGTLLSVDEVMALLAPDRRDQIATRRARETLSPRAREILQLVATGRTNAEISSLLGIGHRTVEHHLTNAYASLNARGRAEAVKRAYEAGYLETDSPELVDTVSV